eukprot:TRINITY_DN3791_c0_g1_i1.p1 TRINITY_DN3791_c0_g1~~TRINITY_DN3791_c0_g1_i1.p1  ORF type:complete len:452 (-),score=137.85 TRINITY_DN3791_c0_g1_i1:257-1612(-)
MAVERKRTTAEATAAGLRVFLAGIPWHADEDLLRKDFSECGVIEDLFVIRDSEGNSKGRAFLTFQEKSAVQAALQYDNTPYGGRTIYVKVAEAKRNDSVKPSRESSAPEGKKASAQGTADSAPEEKPEGCVSLCLKNIGNATEADVRKFLKGCSIQACRIVYDRVTQEARGICFVDFHDTEDVDKAIAFKGKKLLEQVVEMKYEAPRSRPRPEGCLTVAIKKCPPQTKEADIRRLFEGIESLSEVRIICERWKKTCNGLAFAQFTEGKDVEKAVRRDGMSLHGQTVFICFETKTKKERVDTREQGEKPEKKKAKAKTVVEDAEEDLEEAKDAEELRKAKQARKMEARKLRRKRKAAEADGGEGEGGKEDNEGEKNGKKSKKKKAKIESEDGQKGEQTPLEGERDEGNEEEMPRDGAEDAGAESATKKKPRKKKTRKAMRLAAQGEEGEDEE